MIYIKIILLNFNLELDSTLKDEITEKTDGDLKIFLLALLEVRLKKCNKMM